MIGRRALLAVAGALVAAPALAQKPGDPESWIAYERRLQDRLNDAGGGVFDDALAEALLRRTNAVRDTAGAGPCAWQTELAAAARAHAADLAARHYVEHLAPEGFEPGDRLGLVARSLIATASENIAFRRTTSSAAPDELMAIWRRSPPHWANLLRSTHTAAGFGVVVRREGVYAVGLYARPDGVLGAPLPFRIDDEAQLAAAIRGASPPFRRFFLTDPGDAGRPPPRPRENAWIPPGVHQLRPRRPREGRPDAALWGPIFVRA